MDFITDAIVQAVDDGPRGKPKKPRDQQRSKVYAAEKAAFPGFREEMTLAEVDQFVDEVWRSAVIKRIAPAKWLRANPPRISDGRGRRSACSWGGRISIPRTLRMRWVVLHELAHEVTFKSPDHGPHFVANYLALVEWFIGFEARERLGHEMLKRRVKTRP